MFQKQLTAYVAWVNSQLKKKPGAHLVEDLRHDVRDGTALVDLIEVIGKPLFIFSDVCTSLTREIMKNIRTRQLNISVTRKKKSIIK